MNVNKRRNRGPKVVSALGFIILIGLVSWIYFDHEISAISPGDTKAIHVPIGRGDRSRDIAEALVEKGLVRNTYAALAAIYLSGKGSELKAGTYALNKSMPAVTMIDLIAAGKTDVVTVTIPEGFTIAQIADRLSAAGLADRIQFVKAAATQGESYVFDDGFAPPRSLEGFLFPLTYTIIKQSSPHEIVGQMLGEFDQHIVSKHPEVHDWRKAVIVASLVEREAKVDTDRPLIASVYYNRLRLNMPLQCDATVQYALPSHKARLMYSDLRIDSPYNTYLHRGLPPGPICNPGAPSIEAAISPIKTDYLFYVAGPSGAHIFSRTLAEQDRAIAAIRTTKREM